MLRGDRESVAGHLALLRHLPRQRPHHGAMLKDGPVRSTVHRNAGKSVSDYLGGGLAIQIGTGDMG